jgi:hypothetical protein
VCIFVYLYYVSYRYTIRVCSSIYATNYSAVCCVLGAQPPASTETVRLGVGEHSSRTWAPR